MALRRHGSRRVEGVMLFYRLILQHLASSLLVHELSLRVVRATQVKTEQRT